MVNRDCLGNVRKLVVFAENQEIEYEDMRGYHKLTSKTYDYLVGAWVFYIVAVGFVRFDTTAKIISIQDMEGQV
jgi:hypothetical protein